MVNNTPDHKGKMEAIHKYLGSDENKDRLWESLGRKYKGVDYYKGHIMIVLFDPIFKEDHIYYHNFLGWNGLTENDFISN